MSWIEAKHQTACPGLNIDVTVIHIIMLDEYASNYTRSEGITCQPILEAIEIKSINFDKICGCWTVSFVIEVFYISL